MATLPNSRLGDLGAMMKIASEIELPSDEVQQKRQLMADLCKLLGSKTDEEAPPAPMRIAGMEPAPNPTEDPALAPRVRQTLACLLEGDSEKQVARKLGLSPHTVHVYVKAIYRHFNVNSRGELLARFVRK